MKVYKVSAWPNMTTKDGRWSVYVLAGEIVEKAGETWVMNGKNLEPTDGWFADRQEAMEQVADAIEAAGRGALRQAEELRAGSTEPAVS